MLLHTGPGGTGLTVGENELAPEGLIAFSVGVSGEAVGDSDGAVLAGVLAGVVAGSFLAPDEQPAVNAPVTTRAAPPTIRVRRVPERVDVMAR